MELDTTIDPAAKWQYEVVATRHDPRTDEGMAPETVVKERSNQSRVRAIQFAQEWAKEGYWASVYSQATGECIIDYAPEGDAR